MTFRAAAQRLRRIQQRLPAELDAAHAATLVAAYRLAIKFSSGSLKARGEYARAAASPHPDPGTINIQSGEFVKAWRVEKQTKFQGSVINDSETAKYMHGTLFMVERPIIEKIRAEIRPIYTRNMEAALRRAISIK